MFNVTGRFTMLSCVGIWVLGNKPVPASYCTHDL